MIPDGDRGEAPVKEVIPVGLHGGEGGFLGGKAAFHEEGIEAVCDGGVGGDGALLACTLRSHESKADMTRRSCAEVLPIKSVLSS